MRWVGSDLHKQYITACALDDDGRVVAEHRRLLPELAGLVAWLQAVGDPVTVAMEATLYWPGSTITCRPPESPRWRLIRIR